MKIDYSKPLTPEQAGMVAQHHNVIYKFLHDQKLPIDGCYGLAAEGLIRAVQAYDQDESLQQYSLITIAIWKMKSMLANEKRWRKRHVGLELSLDFGYEESEESFAAVVPDQKANTGFKQVLDAIEVEALFSQLSPEQRYIIIATAAGWDQTEIGHQIGISQMAVSRRLKKMRTVIRKQYAQEVSS